MLINIRTLLFLATSGVTTAAMAAQSHDSPPPPAVFVSKAAQDGMTEVELGKIALDKSKNAEVRDFAQRMVTDHGKANQELASIAKNKGIDAPKTLDASHQEMVKKFRSEQGDAFDVEYSRHMNMDHDKAIELFEAASKSPDADLAGFAKKTLPTLKEHREMASKLPGR